MGVLREHLPSIGRLLPPTIEIGAPGSPEAQAAERAQAFAAQQAARLALGETQMEHTLPDNPCIYLGVN